ncbi:MAG: hypothetical protein ACOC2L_01560 [Candidatus Sumerlaeota bacterium]
MVSNHREPMASSPLWLAHSGLPDWLNAKINRSAWLVFKTVVELDCARNARPATIEITVTELARLTGLPAKNVASTLEGLRKKKCIALFLPDHPDEMTLIEVKVPLPTPRSSAEVRKEFPFDSLDDSVRLRYASALESDDESATRRGSAGQKDLQRLIDLYFNTVGFKMNTFILDELRLITQRFSREEVEKTFARAAKKDIRSLSWIAKELHRISRRHDRKDTKDKN